MLRASRLAEECDRLPAAPDPAWPRAVVGLLLLLFDDAEPVLAILLEPDILPGRSSRHDCKNWRRINDAARCFLIPWSKPSPLALSLIHTRTRNKEPIKEKQTGHRSPW